LLRKFLGVSEAAWAAQKDRPRKRRTQVCLEIEPREAVIGLLCA